MSVCGALTPRADHAQQMAQFCFAAAAVIKKFSAALDKRSSGIPLKVCSKIGLACGPLVAGVIGRKKYTFDIWGDAVNTASRMYSCGKKDKIQTTSIMNSKLSSQFMLEKRGVVNVKGKGNMTTYWLVKPRDRLKENVLLKTRRDKVLGHLKHLNALNGARQSKLNIYKTISTSFTLLLL
jgi:adenylate cyclase